MQLESLPDTNILLSAVARALPSIPEMLMASRLCPATGTPSPCTAMGTARPPEICIRPIRWSRAPLANQLLARIRLRHLRPKRSQGVCCPNQGLLSEESPCKSIGVLSVEKSNQSMRRLQAMRSLHFRSNHALAFLLGQLKNCRRWRWKLTQDDHQVSVAGSSAAQKCQYWQAPPARLGSARGLLL